MQFLVISQNFSWRSLKNKYVLGKGGGGGDLCIRVTIKYFASVLFSFVLECDDLYVLETVT
jgi:hypothetical protein